MLLALLWLISGSAFAQQVNPASFPAYNPAPIKWWQSSEGGSGAFFSNAQQAINNNYQAYIVGGQHGGWCAGCSIESVVWKQPDNSGGQRYVMTCHSSVYNQSGYCGTVAPGPAWNCKEGTASADPATHPNGCGPPNNNKGCPSCVPGASIQPGMFGDPINAAAGNKYEIKTEYRGTGPFPLEFTWSYNSSGGPNTDRVMDATLGYNRTDNYRRRVVAYNYGSSLTAYVARPDGNTPRFDLVAPNWVPATPMDGTLTSTFDVNGVVTSWAYRNQKNEIEIYDANGQLQSINDASGHAQTLTYDTMGRLSQVADRLGRALVFTYDSSNRFAAISLPEGGSIQFSYDPVGNLQTVTYPDFKSRGYVYNEQVYTAGTSQPHALTGEIDESGRRFSTTTYDSSGRATGTFVASNSGASSATYTSSSDGTFVSTAKIVNSMALTRSVNFQMISGRAVPITVVETCADCGPQ
jgi:YD repeat-containing protein